VGNEVILTGIWLKIHPFLGAKIFNTLWLITSNLKFSFKFGKFEVMGHNILNIFAPKTRCIPVQIPGKITLFPPGYHYSRNKVKINQKWVYLLSSIAAKFPCDL
jgi:hypothetical protein